MRELNEIDKLVWNDIFERDAEIRRLRVVVGELQHQVDLLKSENDGLKSKLRHKTALLGVP